jgi:predicted TIM-barrel fold metal-dependent hydrolase
MLTAVAVQVAMPRGMPTDHPDLEPIWKQAEEQDATVVHHSGASGYPGERDLWDNPFLGRLSSHPWGAMRFIGALIGAGVMDRYPRLHVAVLECGFGWLPFWGRRMDDQVHYMGYVNPDLKKTMWEHLTSGRFFASIVIHGRRHGQGREPANRERRADVQL